MEYTLRVTISPTINEDQYAARVFIARDDDVRHIDTHQVYECNISIIDPHENTGQLVWAMAALNLLTEKLGPDAILNDLAGSRKSMEDLDTPKSISLI